MALTFYTQVLAIDTKLAVVVALCAHNKGGILEVVQNKSGTSATFFIVNQTYYLSCYIPNIIFCLN
jgi:hypothetical protein